MNKVAFKSNIFLDLYSLDNYDILSNETVIKSIKWNMESSEKEKGRWKFEKK